MSTIRTVSGDALTEYLYTKASRLKIPLSGTFELSPVCNFSCKMCYVRMTKKEVAESPRKILSLDDWRRIAREARDGGMLYLLLTGGEPLLWPDFWTLYEELVDMGFLVSINTNGSLIDEAALERFRKRPPRKINITLYGADDFTYRNLCGASDVFQKVEQAVRSLRENKIEVQVNCSLTPVNANDLERIVAFGKNRDVPVKVSTYMFPPIRRDPDCFGANERFTPEDSARYLLRYLEMDRPPEAFKRYLHSLAQGCVDPMGLDEGCVDPVDGKIRCRAAKASFWVTWDGWMTPCGLMPEPKVDLRNRPFADAWKVLTESTDTLRLSGVCSKCPNDRICHPCAAVAYAETGSFSGIPTYKCRMTQEMYHLACKKLRNVDE